MRSARVLLAAVVLAAACDDEVPGGDPEAAPDALLREVQKLTYYLSPAALLKSVMVFPS